MSDVSKIPVQFSERAIDEIKKTILSKKVPSDFFLRVGVRGGGCGVTRIIGFDQLRPDDISWEISGIKIIMDKRHMMHLIGSSVSFYEDEERRGFLFE
jgi:iron-sulfur cluster assembly protein